MVEEPRSSIQIANLKMSAPKSPQLQKKDLRMSSPKSMKRISFGKATSSDHNPMITSGHIHETKTDGTQYGVRNNLFLKVLGCNSLSCKDL